MSKKTSAEMLRHLCMKFDLGQACEDSIATVIIAREREVRAEIKTEKDYFSAKQTMKLAKARAEGVLVVEVRQVLDFVKGLEEA
jgi:hypothetical protein